VERSGASLSEASLSEASLSEASLSEASGDWIALGGGGAAESGVVTDTTDDALGGAWDDWCERLRTLGHRLAGPPFPQTPFDRAEGFRHLTRQLVMALQAEVEHADPAHPSFHRYEEPWVQWGGPNPDNVYQRAPIDPACTYRVTGNVAGVHSMIVSLVEGDMHLGKYGVYSERTLTELDVADDGTVEIVISTDESPGNWLPMHPAARQLLVRQYQSDWRRDAIASLTIECVENAGTPPVPPSPETLAAALGRALTWTEASIEFWQQYTTRAATNTPRNAFSPPATPPGGAPNIGYGGGWWDLGPDQALLIESEVPDADYWTWTIHTNHWLESGEFHCRQTSINHAQAHIDADGRLRIVVCADDPGTPNWIDVEHRPEGLLVYRYVGARSRPVPSARVVATADLRSHLPPDHPRVDPRARRESLADRRAAVLSRYA
jgi:hypothetical protein